jgi:hypothetical protein
MQLLKHDSLWTSDYFVLAMPVSSSSRKEVPVTGQIHSVVSPKPLVFSYPPYVGPGASGYRIPDVVSNDEHLMLGPLESTGVHHSQYASISPLSVLSTAGSDVSLPCFNTLSPPLLNLSPNLSPTASETHRMSPYYDLRESTRRQSSLYGEQYFFGMIKVCMGSVRKRYLGFSCLIVCAAGCCGNEH